jgi:hypothetical protein
LASKRQHNPFEEQPRLFALIDYYRRGEVRLLGFYTDFDPLFFEHDALLHNYAGRGYRIVVCRLKCRTAKSEAQIKSGNLVVRTDELEGIEPVYDFPILKGHFEPGIYRLGHALYFSLADLLDLSEAMFYCDDPYPENPVLTCTPGEMRFSSLGCEDKFVKIIRRHAFSFFDIICPFCGQKVFSRKKNPNCSIDPNVVENFCPHYAGRINWPENIFLEGAAIKQARFFYQVENGEIYFETGAASKQLQKPYVYRPPAALDSYWNNSAEPAHNYCFFFVQV